MTAAGRIVLVTIAGVLALILVFYLALWIDRPSDHEFVVMATSYYSHVMTQEGLSAIASYDDCQVVLANVQDREQGVSRNGLCSTEDEAFRYYFAVALSPTANVLFSDFDKVAK